eukprot:s2250_g7.t1
MAAAGRQWEGYEAYPCRDIASRFCSSRAHLLVALAWAASSSYVLMCKRLQQQLHLAFMVGVLVLWMLKHVLPINA